MGRGRSLRSAPPPLPKPVLFVPLVPGSTCATPSLPSCRTNTLFFSSFRGALTYFTVSLESLGYQGVGPAKNTAWQEVGVC